MPDESMTSAIRMLVLDVLKPLEPSIIKYSQALADVEGIDGVNITVVEVDRQTETIKISLQGKDIEYSLLNDIIQGLGGSIHSIDKVSAGSKMISEVPSRSTHE